MQNLICGDFLNSAIFLFLVKLIIWIPLVPLAQGDEPFSLLKDVESVVITCIISESLHRMFYYQYWFVSGCDSRVTCFFPSLQFSAARENKKVDVTPQCKTPFINATAKSGASFLEYYFYLFRWGQHWKAATPRLQRAQWTGLWTHVINL